MAEPVPLEDLRASVRKERRTEQAVALYGQGLNSKAIAERLGVSPSWVCQALKAAGITARRYTRQGAA